MTEQNNGEQLSPALTKFEKQNDYFESIEEKMFIIPNKLPECVRVEAFKAINSTKDERRQLTEQDCADYCISLAQYNIYLNRIYQKASANVKWLENQIESAILHQLNEYDKYLKMEDKKRLAIAENEAAQNLNNIKIKVELFKERISYLVQRVDELIGGYKALGFTKRRENG